MIANAESTRGNLLSGRLDSLAEAFMESGEHANMQSALKRSLGCALGDALTAELPLTLLACVFIV